MDFLLPLTPQPECREGTSTNWPDSLRAEVKSRGWTYRKVRVTIFSESPGDRRIGRCGITLDLDDLTGRIEKRD
jgi:hypothetical protein